MSSKPEKSALAPAAPTLKDIIKDLCRPASYQAVYHHHWQEAPMPSVEALADLVERLRAVIFPGYYGPSDVTPESMGWHVGANLDHINRVLAEQIMRGICFVCSREETGTCEQCQTRSQDLALRFLARLPHIREMLAGDVQAAYEGDPAAKSPGETIYCYPSILAVTNYRIAHELYRLGVALIPRIITELAHSRTGIDIHPGASIGKRFFIDHGTGVVIGETSVIGDNVRLYQGVTLGAKSFPKDAKGNPIKGIPRHPVVEDKVIIYSGATILGRVTIGQGAVIGGNVWLTRDVPPGARVLQGQEAEAVIAPGEGV
jgi:serine O-acetyltransferase